MEVNVATDQEVGDQLDDNDNESDESSESESESSKSKGGEIDNADNDDVISDVLGRSCIPCYPITNCIC